ncbi:DUF1624 domain-containing protein [Shinella sp. BYT-45]|uniref:DUF1624 domain-containing protein n=1 Tax=Shinella sp. BYT-45 TaxID=3377377 RepID=UPI0039802BD6
MAIYHFTWDLGFFGYIEPETATTGGWRLFARLIAGSFLFLAGFSLVLGHASGFRPRPFLIRFGKIALAAALITIATWFAFPQTFIFFGILHAIAAASLVGLLFLRLPVAVTLLAAAAAVAAPLYLRSPAFDHPALWWIGLSANVPRSNDYVPLLPWLAPVLLGIALARLFVASTLPERLAGYGNATRVWWKSLLEKAGRHSLAIYLVHQPLLIALVYGFSLVVPAPAADPVTGYTKSCMRACGNERSAGFCQSFCGCTLDRLREQDLFADLNRGAIDVASDERIGAISSQCTADAEKETDFEE